MKKIIAIAAMAAALVGCGTKIETITVTKNNYIPVVIDKKLLKPFVTTSLIDQVSYTSMSADNSREVLLNMIIERNTVIQSCNIRMASIVDESNKIEAIINERNNDGSGN